jgi:hypothetical protein
MGAGNGGAADQRRRLPRPSSSTGKARRFSPRKQGAHQAQGRIGATDNAYNDAERRKHPPDVGADSPGAKPAARASGVVARGANNPTRCTATASPGTAAGGDASRANAHKEAGASGESRGTRKQDGHSPGAAQRVLGAAASVRKALSSLRATAAATDGGTGCTCTQGPPLPPAA